jgi:hypothetical protein
VLIAATFAAIGFAFDAGSGNKELGAVFGGCYALGCVVAVLAVRQAGIFTAVIQPPLILFVSVPTSYYLFTSGQSNDIKDTLINCGYPLIERFPLMFFTSAVVLLIGMARWYFGMSARRSGGPQSTAKETTVGGLASKLSALFSREPDDNDDEDVEPRRRRTQERPTRSTRTASAAASRNGRPSSRAATSRHARPPANEYVPPSTDRPRRSRTGRQEPPPMPPAEPRRRPRPTSSTPRRATPPPDRRTGYERPEMRPERGERRRRYDDYEPLEPHGSNGTNGNGTHHPISRVRYRGADDGADTYGDYRPRRRTPRDL